MTADQEKLLRNIEETRAGFGLAPPRAEHRGCSVATEGGNWQPIATRPQGEFETYLLANAKGQVAPCIRGIIHNNVGTAWDWNYGEAATHWQPLPAPPKGAA